MDDFDPWGDEPDWTRDEVIDRNDGIEGQSEDLREYAAQHVLILIDTHPSMFVPCITVRNDGEDDESDAAVGNEDSYSQNQSLTTPFDAALIACERLLHDRVRTIAFSRKGKRDGVGILLYGNSAVSKKSNQGMNDESESLFDSTVISLVNLEPPGNEEIKALRSCLLPSQYACTMSDPDISRERDLEFELFGDTVATVKAEDNNYEVEDMRFCPLRPALYEASKCFANAKCVKKVGASSKELPDEKAIWIFTNQQDPTQGNTPEGEILVTAARDTVDNGIDVRVWPLPISASYSPNNKCEVFDRSVFFNRITTVDEYYGAPNSSDDVLGGTTVIELESMLERISLQFFKLRKSQTIPLLLPDQCRHNSSDDEDSESSIMLDLFSTVMTKRKPSLIDINMKNNKRIHKVTEKLTKDTGEIIPKEELKKRLCTFVDFGGDLIPMSKEDKLRIVQSGNINPEKANLALLGFKPKPPDHDFLSYKIIGSPILAYPNESVVKGSTCAFATLHKAMIRKNVIGIGELLTRVTCSSRIVAIIPQDEKRTVDDEINDAFTQIVPPGFLIVPLAYEDDIRPIPAFVPSEHVANEEMVKAAENLIKSQIIDDNDDFLHAFENPALEKFWNYIDSIALDVPHQQYCEENDVTKMRVDDIIEAAGIHIDEFMALLPEDKVLKPKKKRKAELPPDDTGIDWFEEYKNDNLESFKINELKSFLRSFGEKMSGKKADLVERVKEHIKARFATNVKCETEAHTRV